jgi:hypothetical protein
MITAGFYVFGLLLVAILFRVAYLYGVANAELKEAGRQLGVKDDQLKEAAKPRISPAAIVARMRAGNL